MSWADGVLSVWSWGKQVRPHSDSPHQAHPRLRQGLLATYDQHLRPACPTCPTSASVPAPPLPPPPLQQLDQLQLAGVMPGAGVTRLAGLSGAAAVALGAYGAHVLNVAKEGVTEEQRKAFEVANR